MPPSISAAIVAGSPGAVLVLDEDGHCQDANPAACMLLGYSRDELSQPRGAELIPGDATWLEEALATCCAVGSWRGGVELQRKDGTVVSLAAWSLVIPGPERSLYVVFLRDRIADTSQESLNSRLAAVVHASADAILSVSPEGDIIAWNAAAERLYGYTAEEAIGQAVAFLAPPERAGEIEGLLARLRTGERIEDFETVRRRKDGRLIEVTLSAAPVHNAEGEVVATASIARDITDRRRMEAELRAAEAKYRSLVEHLPAIISINAHDATSSTLYMSPQVEEILGYTLAEYTADPASWLQIVHPDDRERVLAEITRTNITGEPFRVEYRKIARDGRVVWLLDEAILVRDEAGQPLHWQTVQVDVTKRKEAEEALRRSEERFRTAFDHASIGMALVGLDGRILQVNAALCELTGYSEPELLATTFQEISHPEDLHTDLEHVQRLVAGEISSYRMEKRYLHKTGQVIWGHLSGSLVRDEHGVPLYLIGQVEDITPRKRAEEEQRAAQSRYRALVEQLPAVVYILANNENFTPLFYSSYIETMTGFTPEQALARTDHWLEHVHSADRERIAALDVRTTMAGEPFSAEYRRLRRDGGYVWVQDECVPLRDESGQIVAWQGVMFDITERKIADAALREALESAQAANRAKGSFLDMMSHELRTPLQAVLGYSEFLLNAPRGSLTVEQREDIGYIHQAGGRMIGLINQLLDLSRMEAGRLELAAEPVDLTVVTEQVRQDIAPQAAAKALAVRIDLPKSLPSVIGDEDRVRQILLNLVGNAVKFTNEGSICIAAAASIPGGVEVVVSDTGIGIPAEALPHIFEQFRQVDNSLTRRHRGSGLGLAIASKLAEQMGGSISVSSEPDAGSTFRLHLPADHPEI